jgi:hypothetical protein
VRRLGDPTADPLAAEQELRRAGPAAVRALERGLDPACPLRRARCARILGLNGDRDGDRCLLQMLRERGGAEDDFAGAMAETFLLSVWAQRDAPPPLERHKALSNPGSTALLTGLLEKYPGWSAGHVLRAEASLRSGDFAEARFYALQALVVEPENFTAMVVLARAWLALEAPSHATICLERAVGVNPRLKRSLEAEIRDALRGVDLERARRRRELRRQEPAA